MMRSLLILGVGVLAAAIPAAAQVTVDLHALQALPEQASPPPRTAAAPRPPAHPHEKAAAPAPAAPPPPMVSKTAPTQPALPESTPATATIAPIPPAPEAAPPPPTVSDKAATEAAPTVAGLRLTFAPGQSDLSPDSMESIKQLAAAAPANDSVSFNVMAYAPGNADDPSTARRVSLSRAMAVRSALIGDGVSSVRIYVRALGEQYGSGPPDRVDVNVLGANAPSRTAAPATSRDAAPATSLDTAPATSRDAAPVTSLDTAPAQPK